ncbi:MAG: SDR family oxidoreductase [Planctomycetia bacterium]|nr:SDR family oxidoreductase [Planctomycetia bacterium]
MKHYVRGKVVIVTGASSGFGAATAKMLHEMGAQTVLVGRHKKTLDAVGKTLKEGNWLAVPADCTRTEGWNKIVAATLRAFRKIDVLVNCHGGGVQIDDVEKLSDDVFQAVLDLNLTSCMKGARAVIPEMRKNGFGHIVNISSCCVQYAWASWAVYTAAKAGVAGLTRCLQKEMEPWGGKATCVFPGAARTRFSENAHMEPNWNDAYPTGEEIARTIVHCVDVPPSCVIDEVSILGVQQVRDVLNPF